MLQARHDNDDDDCSSRRIVLALNNLQRLICQQTKPYSLGWILVCVWVIYQRNDNTCLYEYSFLFYCHERVEMVVSERERERERERLKLRGTESDGGLLWLICCVSIFSAPLSTSASQASVTAPTSRHTLTAFQIRLNLSPSLSRLQITYIIFSTPTCFPFGSQFTWFISALLFFT